MSIKKILLYGTTTLLLLPFVASAQNNSLRAGVATETEVNEQVRSRVEARVNINEETIELRKQERMENQEKIEQVKKQIDNRRAEAQNKIHEKLLNLHEITISRFEAGINRLNILADRIESRITKIEAEGIEMTESRELLESARAKISLASELMLKIELSTEANYEDKSEITSVFRNIQNQIQETRRSIISAHSALVDVVVNIKPGQARLDAQTEASTETE
jgi:hypothetical protein